jgi:hypothetical protein
MTHWSTAGRIPRSCRSWKALGFEAARRQTAQGHPENKMPEEPSPFPLPSPENASIEELRAGYRHLRTLFHCVAISLILLTGTVFIFLYRQVVLVRRQSAQLARYGVQYEAFGNRKAIENLREKLVVFARQNADFGPIFTKYFGTNAPPPSESAMPTAQPRAHK